MVKLKDKRNKSDYWDNQIDENKDFIARSDRGGKNPGGVTVMRKKDDNPETEKRIQRNIKKAFEAQLKHEIVDKKKSDSKFFPVTTKGK